MKIANVLISNVWGDVGPSALERGIGGREGAMIYLSREWAKFGHEVTNFVNTERGKRFKEKYFLGYIEGSEEWDYGFHEYIPLNMTKGMLQNFPYDVVIAWECPSIFNDPLVRENVGVKICEMQVAHLNPGELDASHHLDYMAGLSDWHCEFLLHQGVDLPKERFVTLPNGVDITRYKNENGWLVKRSSPKKNWKFVYSSSPDRGLWNLLKAWPEIRKLNKKAELAVGYGVKGWCESVKYSHGRVAEMAVEITRLMNQPGIKDIGKIGQQKLSQLQINSDAWLYPFDPIQPTETGCITAIENTAAGNPLITTDADCMESEFGEVGEIVPLPFDVELYVDTVERVMTDKELYEHLQTQGFSLASSRDWPLIARQWETIFRGEVQNVEKQTVDFSFNAELTSGVR